MRELLLLFCLISLGYFAESVISLALNRSCEIYEDAATTARNAERSPVSSSRATGDRSRIARNSIGRNELHLRSPGEAKSNEDQLILISEPDVNEVSISQTSSKARRTIR